MKRVQKILLLLFVLSLTSVLGGCQDKKDSGEESQNSESSKEVKAEPAMGGSIVVGIPQDLEDSLDPHKMEAAGTKEVLFNIYEGLVKPDEKGDCVDAVAKSHAVSEDGKVYSFVLREGVKFHNGTDVTPEDVKFSIERCAGIAGGTEPLIAAFSNVENVEIQEGNNIAVHLKEADTGFLPYFTVPVIPKDAENLDTQPVGTGPFMYESRSPQENIKIKKFSDYWDKENQAYLDEVTFKIVSDTNAIVTNLKGGSVDMFARINSTQSAELKDGDFTIYEGGMNLVQALYLNNAVAPFDNAKVRQALCYAVNRQEVLDMTADGKGTVIGSSMFPAFEKYYMPELAEKYSQDAEKAKELLKEAGYPDGFEMTITVPSNYQQHVDAAQVLVEQLKQVGVKAKIQMIEWDSWLKQVYTDREFQTTVVGVDAGYLSARAMLERFTSDSSKNFINFKSDEYDRLYQQVTKNTDDAQQTELYKKMETILSDEAANVYIQDLASEVALNKKYGGYVFYPLYVLDMAKIYQVEN